MFTSVIQCTAAWYINVREFLIIKTNNLARIANAHLHFIMATMPYLLYITTGLYLNTTYTVLSTKNGFNRLIQMMIIDILQLMA